MRAGFGDHCFRSPTTLVFFTLPTSVTIGPFERGKHLLNERPHLGERRAKDNEIRTRNSSEQVGRGKIRCARAFTILDARLAPHIAGDLFGKFTSTQGRGQKEPPSKPTPTR